MRNMIWLMSVGTALCLATAGMAQPRGGERGGPGTGADRLSAALEKIDARLKELERQVDRQRPATGAGVAQRPGGVAGPMTFGGGGGVSRPFGPSHRFGLGASGGSGPGSAREFQSRFGGGPAAAGQASAERRIDHIINELEQLKKDLRGPRH